MSSTNLKNKPSFLITGISEEAILRWLVFLLSLLIGGVPGLLAIVVAQLLFEFSAKYAFGKARRNSLESTELKPAHPVSRLGGIVVIAFVWLSCLWLGFVGNQFLFDRDVIVLLSASSSMFLIGLADDFELPMGSKIKFALMLAVVGLFFWFFPESLELTKSSLMFHSSVAYVFILFALVIMVKSFNTIDGANGLVSGVSLSICIALIQLGLGLTGGLLALVATGCTIFMLFNVVVGRIFLGVGGAYFLGSVLVFTMISVLVDNLASPWYLLCLVFYPHADLLFSLLRRKWAGKSVFGRDNGHLHNLIYRKLSSIPLMKPYANTTTGLAIAATFAVVPLLVWNYISAVNWMLVYAGLWFLYASAWVLLSDHKTRDLMII